MTDTFLEELIPLLHRLEERANELHQQVTGVVQDRLDAEKNAREENYKRRKAEATVECLAWELGKVATALHNAEANLVIPTLASDQYPSPEEVRAMVAGTKGILSRARSQALDAVSYKAEPDQEGSTRDQRYKRRCAESEAERLEDHLRNAKRELEIVGNFLAAGSFTPERVKILRDRVDAALATLDASLSHER